MTDKFTNKGFAELAVEEAGYEPTVYDERNKLINWCSIEKVLNRKYKKRTSADGRPAYPAIIKYCCYRGYTT